MSHPRENRELAVTLILVVVAAAVIGNFFLRSFRGSGSRPPNIASPSAPAPDYVRHWERGIDVGMLAYGSQDAPVTILAFYDYQCPFCRVFSETLDSVLALYPEAIRVVLIDYPLDYHPFSITAAHAATCAHELGVLPAWVEAAYRNQDVFGLKSWGVIAGEIGVADSTGFDRCVDSEPASDRIHQSLEFGEAIGVEGTPTVVIDGWRYRDPPSKALLMALLNSTLGRETVPLSGDGQIVSLHLDSLPLSRRMGIHEELRIGDTLDVGASLNTVGQALVGDKMSIVISQPTLPGVLVFDSIGRLDATFGGQGEGPGEFQDLLSIGMLGDTLYVTDRGSGRVTYFHNRQLLESRRWIADIAPRQTVGEVLLVSNVPAVVLGDNRALVRPNLMALRTKMSTEISTRLPVWLVDEESQVLGTVIWEELSGVGMTVTHRGTQFQAIVPLQQKSFTQLGPSGSGAVTVSYSVGHLTVTGIDSSGDTLFVRELEYTPLPLSDDGIREAVLEMQIVPAMAEAEKDAVRSAFEKMFRRKDLLPEYLPPISDLFVGQDGSIWLRRKETGGEMIDYSVLWGDGTPRGTIAIPTSPKTSVIRRRPLLKSTGKAYLDCS